MKLRPLILTGAVAFALLSAGTAYALSCIGPTYVARLAPVDGDTSEGLCIEQSYFGTAIRPCDDAVVFDDQVFQ